MERANKFARGQWADLLEELCHYTHSSRPAVTRSKDSTCGVEDLGEKDAEQKKTWRGSVQSGEAGPGIASATGLDRCSTGPRNVGDTGRVATTQTARTGPRDPTRSDGAGPKAARASHDSPRAQTCVVEGPGLQKHEFHEKTSHEREERLKIVVVGELKKSEILGGPGEGGLGEGGPGEGRYKAGEVQSRWSHKLSRNVCSFFSRIGRLNVQWSVNKFARAITKWTRACDKRLARLISYLHFTSEYKQNCHVGFSAHQCRLGLFQD